MARAYRLIWALAGTLLLATMPLLWVRSYVRGDTILWLRGGGRTSLQVMSQGGRLDILITRSPGSVVQPPLFVHLADTHYADVHLTFDVDAGMTFHGWQNFHWSTVDDAASPLAAAGVFAIAPHWPFSMPGLLLMAVAVRRAIRRRRRRKLGLCITCGYDLRESRERCPECGTAVPLPPRTGCDTLPARR